MKVLEGNNVNILAVSDEFIGMIRQLSEKVELILSHSPIQYEDDRPMDIDELAVYLGLSNSYIYKMVNRQEIPYNKIGHKILRFDKKEINKWLASYHVPAAKEAPRKIRRSNN